MVIVIAFFIFLGIAMVRGDFATFLSDGKSYNDVYLPVSRFAGIVAERVRATGRNESLLFLATDGTAKEVNDFKMQMAGERH